MKNDNSLHSHSTSLVSPGRSFVLISLILFGLASFHHDLGFYYPRHEYSITHDVETDFSAVQAEALLKGRLDVLPTPTDLLLLQNPYDPDSNITTARCCGYHDLAFFNGKIYAPQGFGTAFLVDIPSRLLTLGYANPPLKNLLLVIVGSWSLLQLSMVIRQRLSTRAMSASEVALAYLVVLVINPATWLVVSGGSYEAAVSGGYMGLVAGSFLLCRGLDDRSFRARLTHIVGGTALLMLGAVARPSIAPIVVTVFLGALFYIARLRISPTRKLRDLSLIAIPVSTVGAFWMWFNDARFGRVMETGHAYQLAGFDMRTYSIGSLDFIARNIQMYLFTPFRFEREFPFFALANNTASADLSVQSHEALVGFATGYPFLLVTPLLCVLGLAYRRRNSLAALMTLVIASSVGSLTVVSFLFKDSTMRYLPDFSTAFVVTSAILVSISSDLERLSSRIGSWLARVVLSSAFSWSLAVSLGILVRR